MSLGLEAEAWTTQRILDAEQRYVIRSWSVQGTPAQAAVERGEGCWFWDTEGNRYLDFQSQLVNLNLGHQHPKLVEAIVDQVRQMAYMGPNFAVRVRAELGEAIAQVAPGDWRGYVRVRDESVQTSTLTEKVLERQQPEDRLEKLPLNKDELRVLDYLKTTQPRITVAQYTKLINVSRRRAYRTLIKLVLHGYLRYHDKEKEPYYTL